MEWMIMREGYEKRKEAHPSLQRKNAKGIIETGGGQAAGKEQDA